ncbi:MAG: hypothetical protein P4L33_10025 [Capsulimonadaceae bacterium]|nr:hypothetical protein [Capsulimonadaceae bacterium]
MNRAAQLTNVDRWFLTKLSRLVALDAKLRGLRSAMKPAATPEALAAIRTAKTIGFGDRHLSELLQIPEPEIRALVKSLGIKASYKMVDTCAAEFEAQTPYFYSVFDDDETEVAA